MLNNVSTKWKVDMSDLMHENRKEIAIIGAGEIGISVAVCFLSFGYNVILLDKSKEIINNSRKRFINEYKHAERFYGNTRNYDERLSMVSFTSDYAELLGKPYIIENTTEDWETKEIVYRSLGDVCDDHTLIMANTSCISITKIASLLNHNSNVIGLHFMNPAYLIKFAEVIKGQHTSDATVEKVYTLLHDIGKSAITINDFAGFVSNRISHTYINEAAFVVQDRVAEAKDVDMIFRNCFGHKMGPLETADLIGIDTVVRSLDVLFENYHDSKYRCCILLRKMVAAGFFGKKSGKGFYEYDDEI